VFFIHRNKNIIIKDIRRGLDDMGVKHSDAIGLIYLLAFCDQFRNIFYFRTRPYSSFLNILCPQLSSLKIQVTEIGEGLIFVHGFASAIGGWSIGKNCKIYQQVTIGGTKHGAPVIGDNVTIYPGAIILGNVKIGNDVVIGANSTVYKNVPDNSTVLPGTSRVMKWKSM
jgi:serine O-acetyltransferase